MVGAANCETTTERKAIRTDAEGCDSGGATGAKKTDGGAWESA